MRALATEAIVIRRFSSRAQSAVTFAAENNQSSAGKPTDSGAVKNVAKRVLSLVV